jgi:hypothetical protein
MQNINDLLQNQNQNQNSVFDDAAADESLDGLPQDLEEVEENKDGSEIPANNSQIGISAGGEELPEEQEIDEAAQEENAQEAESKDAIAAQEENAEEKSDMPASKFLIIKEIIENIKNELSKINELLRGSVSEKDLEEMSKKLVTTKMSKEKEEGSQMKVVEGVFDGQNMIGGDGEHYSVPANYASKSKLVEGDLLKLTILQDGSFIYKQIAPIERRRVVGSLAYDEASDQYYVLAEGKRWKVLRASITYFKGEPGEEVTIVVPKDTPSQWGAVENVLKK